MRKRMYRHLIPVAFFGQRFFSRSKKLLDMAYEDVLKYPPSIPPVELRFPAYWVWASGGIGRHNGLKIRRSLNDRKGSSPFSPTIDISLILSQGRAAGSSSGS